MCLCPLNDVCFSKFYNFLELANVHRNMHTKNAQKICNTYLTRLMSTQGVLSPSTFRNY